MIDPNVQGAIAETAIAAHATRLGIEVFRPLAHAGKVDCVFLWPDGGLARIQCKAAKRRGDVVSVRLYSTRRGANGFVRSGYDASVIDAVVAYCQELDRCYYIPAREVAGKREMSLRLQATRNSQEAGVHYAEQYDLGAIAQLGERLHGMQEVAGSSPASSTVVEAAR